MVELFTLVALWCGQPINQSLSCTDSQGTFRQCNKEGTSVSVDDVSSCRTSILNCMQGKDKGPSQFYYKYDPQCFVKQKLK
jgi:hypothetical protein